MVEKTAEVQLKMGLQARPAALFVQEANRFSSEIFLEKDGKKVNAKSIMGIMSLAINRGCSVTISVDGHDEQGALEALVAFVQQEGSY
ncbi:HPr family phosphocarrier protein [Bacillus sp. REN10]|uniref:HPr family phosphocarrier protein n=1 Tax=Bacillus sp. REN10 TaxID=2782541 RepID=UPI00193B9191|nr:HPr family phosphocarrier protein [Bacillus sp. REN10]